MRMQRYKSLSVIDKKTISKIADIVVPTGEFTAGIDGKMYNYAIVGVSITDLSFDAAEGFADCDKLVCHIFYDIRSSSPRTGVSISLQKDDRPQATPLPKGRLDFIYPPAGQKRMSMVNTLGIGTGVSSVCFQFVYNPSIMTVEKTRYVILDCAAMYGGIIPKSVLDEYMSDAGIAERHGKTIFKSKRRIYSEVSATVFSLARSAGYVKPKKDAIDEFPPSVAEASEV